MISRVAEPRLLRQNKKDYLGKMSRVKQPEEGGSESLTVNMPIVMPLSE
jgi:hypothetical protein